MQPVGEEGVEPKPNKSPSLPRRILNGLNGGLGLYATSYGAQNASSRAPAPNAWEMETVDATELQRTSSFLSERNGGLRKEDKGARGILGIPIIIPYRHTGFLLEMTWDAYAIYYLFMVFATYFLIIYIPFEVAFAPSSSLGLTKGSFTGYDTVSLVLKIIFGIDVCVNFFVAYFDERRGRWVTSQRAIALNYLKFWFWIDLTAVFPFESLDVGLHRDNQLVRALILIRLFRLTRIYRVWQIARFLEYSGRCSLLALTIFRNLNIVLLFIHYGACMFFFIGSWFTFHFEPLTPANSADAFFQLDREQVYAMSVGEQYITSLYWSTITFATVGYGDISPITIEERVFTTIYTICNIGVLAFITGTFTLVVTKGDEQAGVWRTNFRQLRKFIRTHHMPPDLRTAMKKHLELHFLNEQGADDRMLAFLPSTLRKRALQHIFACRVKHCYLFKDPDTYGGSAAKTVSTRFLDAFLTHAKIEVYVPPVDIVEQGAFVGQFMILTHGFAKVITRDNVDDRELDDEDGETIDPGSAIAEVAFFTHTAQRTTVRALESCRVLSVNRATYRSLEAMFPVATRQVISNLNMQAILAITIAADAMEDVLKRKFKGDGSFPGPLRPIVKARKEQQRDHFVSLAYLLQYAQVPPEVKSEGANHIDRSFSKAGKEMERVRARLLATDSSGRGGRSRWQAAKRHLSRRSAGLSAASLTALERASESGVAVSEASSGGGQPPTHGSALRRLLASTSSHLKRDWAGVVASGAVPGQGGGASAANGASTRRASAPVIAAPSARGADGRALEARGSARHDGSRPSSPSRRDGSGADTPGYDDTPRHAATSAAETSDGGRSVPESPADEGAGGRHAGGRPNGAVVPSADDVVRTQLTRLSRGPAEPLKRRLSLKDLHAAVQSAREGRPLDVVSAAVAKDGGEAAAPPLEGADDASTQGRAWYAAAESALALWKARYTQARDVLIHVFKHVKSFEENQQALAISEVLMLAAANDYHAIKQRLEHGFSPNLTDASGRTPLMVAAAHGSTAVVQELLLRGASVTDVDRCGNCALMDACRGGHDGVIAALRAAGADLKKLYSAPAARVELAMIMNMAVHKKEYDFLARLLAAGAPPSLADYNKRTPLHIAAMEANFQMATLLLDHGADIYIEDSWGNSPITDANLSDSPKIYLQLLSQHEKNKDRGIVKVDLSSGGLNHPDPPSDCDSPERAHIRRSRTKNLEFYEALSAKASELARSEQARSEHDDDEDCFSHADSPPGPSDVSVLSLMRRSAPSIKSRPRIQRSQSLQRWSASVLASRSTSRSLTLPTSGVQGGSFGQLEAVTEHGPSRPFEDFGELNGREQRAAQLHADTNTTEPPDGSPRASAESSGRHLPPVAHADAAPDSAASFECAPLSSLRPPQPAAPDEADGDTAPRRPSFRLSDAYTLASARAPEPVTPPVTFAQPRASGSGELADGSSGRRRNSGSVPSTATPAQQTPAQRWSMLSGLFARGRDPHLPASAPEAAMPGEESDQHDGALGHSLPRSSLQGSQEGSSQRTSWRSLARKSCQREGYSDAALIPLDHSDGALEQIDSHVAALLQQLDEAPQGGRPEKSASFGGRRAAPSTLQRYSHA